MTLKPAEAKRITTLSVNHKGPMYIRLGKAGEKYVHNEYEHLKFGVGEIIPIIESDSDTAIFATGSILYQTMTDILERHSNYALYSVPYIKPMKYDDLF